MSHLAKGRVRAWYYKTISRERLSHEIFMIFIQPLLGWPRFT
jgi:hypothetical protein